jgi:DNA replication protein DnaC
MEVVKLVKILAGMRPGGETTQETIDKLCLVPILAIDDIGAHKPSEWVNERLYEIIDTRYDNMLPIVATTNRKNVDAVLDDRLASRFEECCEMVFLTGTDRRRQA